MLVKRIMEDAHHGGVSPAEYPDDSPAVAAVGPGWSEFYQYLIALHGAVHLILRNKDIVIAAGLAGLRPDESKTVPMHIQTAGYEVIAQGGLREGPVIAVRFNQFAPRSHTVELLHQHATLSAATEAQFANQLLIARPLAGRTFDTVEEFAVGHSWDWFADLVLKTMSLLILMGQLPSNPERFGMGDFNFAPSVIKMQRSARISRLARFWPSRQSEMETNSSA
jgi:hypothetical protein